jgi:hypothetical protein
MLKRILVALLLVALAAVPSLAGANPRLIHPQNAIAGEYIGVFEDGVPYAGVDGLAHSLAATYGGTVREVWKDSAKAFHFIGSEAGAEAMLADPRIAYIEADAMHYPPHRGEEESVEPVAGAEAKISRRNEIPFPGEVISRRGGAPLLRSALAVTSNSNTSYWHLDRLDDPTPALDGTYTMTTTGGSV